MKNEEYFDVVNEQNEPTGEKLPRSAVHEHDAYWHRTTIIWVVNLKKEVLCQQRSFKKDENPGKWQSYFGGHVNVGESYDENAAREVQEELGITISIKDLRAICIRKNETHKHFGQVYLLRWDGDISKLTFNDGEVAQVKWISVDELKRTSKNFCNTIDEKVLSFL